MGEWIQSKRYGFLLLETCCACDTPFAMSQATYDARLADKKTFYCPYGHPQSYVGETDAVKYRREAEKLKQQLAQKDDEIKSQRDRREAAERSAQAYRGVATRLKNRAAKGVCPCCNRHFTNLERHMKTKHADFAKDDNVVPLRAEA